MEERSRTALARREREVRAREEELKILRAAYAKKRERGNKRRFAFTLFLAALAATAAVLLFFSYSRGLSGRGRSAADGGNEWIAVAVALIFVAGYALFGGLAAEKRGREAAALAEKIAGLEKELEGMRKEKTAEKVPGTFVAARARKEGEEEGRYRRYPRCSGR